MQMPDFWPIAGVITTLFSVAIVATLKAVSDARSLKLANEEIDILKAEIARLKKATTDQKENASKEFTKPLRYPRINNP